MISFGMQQAKTCPVHSMSSTTPESSEQFQRCKILSCLGGKSLVKSLINQGRVRHRIMEQTVTVNSNHTLHLDRTMGFSSGTRHKENQDRGMGALIGFHIFPSTVSQIMIINQELKGRHTSIMTRQGIRSMKKILRVYIVPGQP